MNEVQYARGICLFICLFIFDYRVLFVCVKESISKNSKISLLLYHFYINFSCPVLFTKWKSYREVKV